MKYETTSTSTVYMPMAVKKKTRTMPQYTGVAMALRTVHCSAPALAACRAWMRGSPAAKRLQGTASDWTAATTITHHPSARYAPRHS